MQFSKACILYADLDSKAAIHCKYMYMTKLLLELLFLFLIETIFCDPQLNCLCDPSSEPSQQDASDEGPQHVFYAELTKIIPNYHQILLLI